MSDKSRCFKYIDRNVREAGSSARQKLSCRPQLAFLLVEAADALLINPRRFFIY